MLDDLLEEKEMMENKWLTIGEAAKWMKVTKQAIYIAIRKGRLKATKEGDTWYIAYDDLQRYKNSRYDRRATMLDDEGGLFLHTHDKMMTVPMMAKLTCIPSNRIYYAIRAGWLPFTRRGKTYLIEQEHANTYVRINGGQFAQKGR